MEKHVIRELDYESTDFSFYFEDDGLEDLFIVGGFNDDEYQRIVKEADQVQTHFLDQEKWKGHPSYKAIMEDYTIEYSPFKCKKLKEWAKNADSWQAEDIAEYITITTGKKWEHDFVRGYSQGDYVDIVYNAELYKNGVKHYGEVWLGCAKEFSVQHKDEDYAVYGYIVADSQAFKDEDYKKLVCEWACIDENETELYMIDSYQTQRVVKYKESI